jgi:hypothetical protein
MLRFIYTDMKKYNMKPIVDLMGESIDKLKKLTEKKHFMKCNNCGLDFDMRHLNQVMKHESCITLN